MGYLLGAVTQEKLDNQRGVVQNEKRQGDNQPGGLVVLRGAGQPVPRRPPLPSLDDRLDGRPRRRQPARRRSTGSLDKYGPNNAVLVLAGDIDAAEARPLVEKYFGAIPRGPVNNAGPGRRADPGRAQVDRDEGPRRAVQRAALLGGARACSIRPAGALDLGGSVLGGLASSRLDEVLVRDEKLAVGGHAGLAAVPARRHVHGRRRR